MPVAKAPLKRILLIDDDVVLSRAIERVASGVGFDVIHSSTGEDGLRLSVSMRADLVILHINVDDLDGIQILGRLKCGPQTCSIPVIVCSASPDHEQRLAVFQLGAEDYFDDPVDVGLLMRRIEHHVFRSSKTTGDDRVSRPLDDTVPYARRAVR